MALVSFVVSLKRDVFVESSFYPVALCLVGQFGHSLKKEDTDVSYRYKDVNQLSTFNIRGVVSQRFRFELNFTSIIDNIVR